MHHTHLNTTQRKNLTPSPIENADPSISAIVDLVPAQCGIAVGLDPHPSHGIVKDLIVLDESQAWRGTRGVVLIKGHCLNLKW